MLETIANLTRFNSKLLSILIVKFFKAVVKVKDEAFIMYLIKKNILKTVIDLFLDNPNKGNMLHSIILELFDFMSKEPNKKLGTHLLTNYSETVFKNQKYEKMFKNFVDAHEDTANYRNNSGKKMSIFDNMNYF